MGESCSDGNYRIRINNLSTLQWEFLDLKDLKNLEKIKGVFLRKETIEWEPFPNNPSELSLLEGKLFTHDFKTNTYIPLDITANLKNVKAYESLL